MYLPPSSGSSSLLAWTLPLLLLLLSTAAVSKPAKAASTEGSGCCRSLPLPAEGPLLNRSSIPDNRLPAAPALPSLVLLLSLLSALCPAPKLTSGSSVLAEKSVFCGMAAPGIEAGTSHSTGPELSCIVVVSFRTQKPSWSWLLLASDAAASNCCCCCCWRGRTGGAGC
jgi:hypothetical protein